MKKENLQMSCEEIAGLGFDCAVTGADLTASERAAVEEHLRACDPCAAQFESWRELRMRLRELAEETRSAQTPMRVETELRWKVMRIGYAHRWERRRTAIAAWALAAAAVIAAVAGARRWTRPATPVATVPLAKAPALPDMKKVTTKQNAAADHPSVSRDRSGETAATATLSNPDEFTLLPGGLPLATDDASIVRVRLQRSALGALGLPVNEEQSGEWVLVDLLVSGDGQPEAVRLAR